MAAVAPTRRERGQATAAPTASSAAPLRYVHIWGEPGIASGMRSLNGLGRRKWAVPMAIRNPARARLRLGLWVTGGMLRPVTLWQLTEKGDRLLGV